MSNEELIKYIVYRSYLHDRNKLTTLKLVKFLYLADYLCVRNKADRITEWEWLFWDFGPWSSSCYKAIQAAVLSAAISTTSHASSFSEDSEFFLFSPTDTDLSEIAIEVSRIERKFPKLMVKIGLDSYINQFGQEHSSKLLDYVYMQTEPMQEASPREILSFETVVTEVNQNTELTKLSKKRIKKGKDLVKKLLEKRAESNSPRFVNKEKDFDRLYFDSLSRVEDEDYEESGIADISSVKYKDWEY